MTSELHLDLLINRAYFEDPATYRTLMAHKAVVVAEREKDEAKAADPDAWMPVGQCAQCHTPFDPPTNQRGYCASCSF